MTKYHVYKITNEVTGWIYIGSTQDNPLKRWKTHASAIRNNTHTIMRMREDCNKYGISSFIFEILAVFDNARDMDFLEQTAIRECLSQGKCYNIKHGDRKTLRQNNDLYWADRLERLNKYRSQEDGI